MVWILGIAVWAGASVVTALTLGPVMGRVGRRDAPAEPISDEAPERAQPTAVGG